MLFKARKESNPSPSTRLLAEAADWVVALEGLGQPTRADLTLNERFYAWLVHSPERLRAFLEISNVYSTLNGSSCKFIVTPGQPAASPDCGGAGSANVIRLERRNRGRRCTAGGALRSFKLMRPVASSPQITSTDGPCPLAIVLRRPRVLAAIAAVVVGAVCAWVLAPLLTAASTDISYHSTRIGERTIIPLKDGSTVYINTASRIVLHSTAKLHSVHLLSGEALLDGSSAAIPLHLGADELQVDSVAAQFDVRREGPKTQVSVLNGQVHVTCRCAAGEIVLVEGEQLEVSHHDGATQVRRRSLQLQERTNLVMWRDGHLSFEGALLADAVQELNRYNRRQLAVGDPETADLRIGGRFLANDVDSFIAAMQKTFGVRAQLAPSIQQDSYVVLLSRNASPAQITAVPSPIAASTAPRQHRR